MDWRKTLEPHHETHPLGLPRIAASSYLNTAPLIWSFLEGSQSREVRLYTDEAPARCADMLARCEVDAALVPVIEYQRLDNIRIVPDVCVGSRRRVRSVVLASRVADLRHVRTVALDTSSRTSAALIQIMFKEFIGANPQFKPAAPDLDLMLENADAALLIGDPAMTFPRASLQVFDMATLWHEYTGHAFVFAMWMVRDAAMDILDTVDFSAARNEGLSNAGVIAEKYETSLGLPLEELREYLLENISFHFDAEMRAGLELFYRLAYKHGLIPKVRPLEFASAATPAAL